MSAVPAPEFSLRASGRLRRRRLVNRLMEALGTIAALLAVAVLALVVLGVAKRGLGAISWAFFTQTAVPFGQTGGGLAHAIVGSAILIVVATVMALPVGILVAIYLTEFARPSAAAAIRTALDVLNGLPSIVIGIFVYGLLVVGHMQSGVAGGFALAVIMLPLVARSAQEVLLLVPASLREAGLALGAARWRTVLGVILPTALGGILTGTILALARAAGETAPLLFTTSIYAANHVSTDPRQALPNLPTSIFFLSESPDPADHQRAWAAALVLMTFVLIASVLGRAALARQRKKLGR
jgi:phosphate transport system permease protein